LFQLFFFSFFFHVIHIILANQIVGTKSKFLLSDFNYAEGYQILKIKKYI